MPAGANLMGADDDTTDRDGAAVGAQAADPAALLVAAVRTLQGVSPFLPGEQTSAVELGDVARASGRGYFLPEEDERLRAAFARYLALRAALFQTIEELRPSMGSLHLRAKDDGGGDGRSLKAFAAAFCAACMLVRSALFLVDHLASDDLVRGKLDEGDLLAGVPRKQFTVIFRSLTRPAHVYRMLVALRFSKDHRERIGALADDCPEFRPAVDLLDLELPFVDALKKRTFAEKRLAYWHHALRRRSGSGVRRVTLTLFEASGRAISEVRNPFHRKRVTQGFVDEVSTVLRAGDVIVTRHEDAMSNLFLPGFWPHAALYIGDDRERSALGVRHDLGHGLRVLESRKDGVRFRALEETLGVDAFCVLRPLVGDTDRAQAIGRAMEHEGKLYDFEFDFTRSDRLVCTEVVYRAYDGLGGFSFALAKEAGRLCLPADMLVRRAVEGRGFEPVSAFLPPQVAVVVGTELARSCIARSVFQDGRETDEGSPSSPAGPSSPGFDAPDA